ncbi:UDP-galactopyranose mutase [Clostridia bacterium]|nr:UDP-galactopyranose mutase [Clostridia bacterium]
MKNALIVGSGLSGAAAARALAEKGYRVQVIEKLPHIGGNAYDYTEEGILLHKYGPHIYHTNFPAVHEFLSRFTEWTPYAHKVVARIDGKFVPVPFNLTSLETLFPKEEADYIKVVLSAEYGRDAKVPVFELRAHKNDVIRKFGDYVFEKIFYHYTVKQWGRKPEALNPDILKRVPVYTGYADGYFTDLFQYMPVKGFTTMTENMLDHANIEVILNEDALLLFKLRDGKILFNGKEYPGAPLIYTGCIDALFGFKYGALAYRTLRFEFERHGRTGFQPAAVVNYPNEHDYTRITEFTKFTCPPQKHTVIMKEYPGEYADGDIPYYPIETPDNLEIHAKYGAEVAGYKNLIPLGRLGRYKYINMDVAVKDALAVAEKL